MLDGVHNVFQDVRSATIHVRAQKFLYALKNDRTLIICKCIMSELGRGWTCLELNAAVMRDD